MEIIARAAAAAIVGSILALRLREYTPERSLTLTVITGTVIVWISAAVAGEITDLVRALAEKGALSSIYISPVMKCVGIGLITQLASQVCRDAQQGSIASAIELCGTLCALYVSAPLVNALLSTVEKLL